MQNQQLEKDIQIKNNQNTSNINIAQKRLQKKAERTKQYRKKHNRNNNNDADNQQRQCRAHGSLKTKVGMFIGYCGEGYLGLQYQRDTQNTIENIIHKTLSQNGFILKSNMGSLKRIRWSRAGRTDKGVHALCNGISASLQFTQKYVIDKQQKLLKLDDALKDINRQLPVDIRILAIKKVGKAFDMRHDACSRIYNYLAPLSWFVSPNNNQILDQMQKDQILCKINEIAARYVGTYNFHNFTKGYKTQDPRCDRYIIKVSAQFIQQEQINRTIDRIFTNQQQKKGKSKSFLRFQLIGQSFIYHQIRKMIGFIVQIFRQDLQINKAFKDAFGKQKYRIYLAPAQGLYLNRMTFDLYNKKKEIIHQVFLDEEDQRKITLFRQQLQQKILSHQLKNNLFTQWLIHHNIQDDQGVQQQQIQSNNQD